MKYFACLEPSTFDDFNLKILAKLLVDKDLFEERLRLNLKVKNGTIDPSSKETYRVITPTQDLKNEFYNYILNHFNKVITEIKCQFYDDFNEEIYGLDLSNQKMIALKHFKEIYNSITVKVEGVKLYNQVISENGVIHTFDYAKLKMLHSQQIANKTDLAISELLEHYLTGNQAFFEENNIIEQYKIVEDLILFEIWKQVLVELNDRYGFEEDYYFTNRNNDKVKFNEYNYIFKSLESYQFTDRKIKSFEKDKKAHIESLYEVLKAQKIIKNHKENFMVFLKKEYEITITKIIPYNEKENYTNDERVTLFTQEWVALTSEN
jgi:hypothetical protein